MVADPAARELDLCPMTLTEAARFVARFHRHHKPPQGGLFAVGATDGTQVIGVATIGRPVARLNDDGWTAEVTRLTTDGTHNACSLLYGAAWRACRALGYRRLITYTLPEEGGASLRGAGYTLIGARGGGTWDRPSQPDRRRVDKHPLGQKLLWERIA